MTLVFGIACNSHQMGDGWPSLRKYVTETPHYIGQFPALAFATHNQHVREGDVIAARQLGSADVFSGKDELGQALSAGGWDTKELTGRLTTPPSALAIGRVTIAFSKTPRSKAKDLSAYHDARAKSLRSTTGELVWHYGSRRVEVRSQKTQAVIGFAAKQPVELPAVRAEIKTQFVSLIFTPLDNEPLVESRHILITAMARDKQTGAEFNDDWSELRQVGGPPLLMEPVQARIRFAGSNPTSVRALDGHGIPREKEVPLEADGSFTIDGRFAAYYYEVRR